MSMDNSSAQQMSDTKKHHYTEASRWQHLSNTYLTTSRISSIPILLPPLPASFISTALQALVKHMCTVNCCITCA